LEQRIRSRLRVRLDDGREAGLFLERGMVLRDGDLLADPGGLTVQVRAAAEPLSRARASDPVLLARACYHLGNRHVPLEIAGQWVRYQPDHVLDQMLRRLGLEVSSEKAPFDPEPGAYDSQGHAHGH
jgi:urease accessory protein